MMDWAQLFSRRRLGFGNTPKPRPRQEGRSDFQRDFDRVIFSPAFRRLQSKTQVVPLPQNDFVHTRLTHSLEASCVGRSLGRIVGDRTIRESPDLFADVGVTPPDFEAVVAAACLAHDIGNPPFGHSGEDAISEYFRGSRAKRFLEGLSAAQIADLQNFEGNAAGFRLLTYTAPSDSDVNMGLGLTFATLGAFTKYPKGALPDLKKSTNASERKFGFFQSEKEIFGGIADELGLLAKAHSAWHRHPLAFLVEAADDICYTIVDFEDGFKVRRVEFETVERLFKGIIAGGFERISARYRKIHSAQEKIGFLRALVINKLVLEVAEIFSDHLPQILSGEFDQHLTDLAPAKPILDEISSISVEYLYRAPEVVEIEIAGFEVLAGLLDAYLQAVFSADSHHSKMVRRLIPSPYLDVDGKPFADKYHSILNIVLLVSGMTDTFAIETYRKIKGIALPSF